MPVLENTVFEGKDAEKAWRVLKGNDPRELRETRRERKRVTCSTYCVKLEGLI